MIVEYEGVGFEGVVNQQDTARRVRDITVKLISEPDMVLRGKKGSEYRFDPVKPESCSSAC